MSIKKFNKEWAFFAGNEDNVDRNMCRFMYR